MVGIRLVAVVVGHGGRKDGRRVDVVACDKIACCPRGLGPSSQRRRSPVGDVASEIVDGDDAEGDAAK